MARPDDLRPCGDSCGCKDTCTRMVGYDENHQLSVYPMFDTGFRFKEKDNGDRRAQG